VLTGFLLIGLVGATLRSSTLGVLIGLLMVAASLFAVYRVLTAGVHVLPSGLLIRELTRTTPVPWARIRAIETGPTGRRGVYAPILVVMLEPASGSRKGGTRERMEVTVLASYHEAVAKRRTAELIAARAAAASRTRRSS
jgi:hypothetical protein